MRLIVCLLLFTPLFAQSFTDRDGRMRLYRSTDESLTINYSGENRIVTESAGDKVLRRGYDKKGRLLQAQVFIRDKMACIKNEVYSYNGDKKSFCIIEEGDKSTLSWIRKEKRYDNGQAVEERVWQMNIEKGEDGKDREKKSLVKVIENRYDEGRLAEVTTITRTDDNKKMVIREEYRGDDTYRYENNVLRMSIVHTDKDDYTRTVVFGEGEETVKVVTVYKDGRKVSSKAEK